MLELIAELHSDTELRAGKTMKYRKGYRRPLVILERRYTVISVCPPEKTPKAQNYTSSSKKNRPWTLYGAQDRPKPRARPMLFPAPQMPKRRTMENCAAPQGFGYVLTPLYETAMITFSLRPALNSVSLRKSNGIGETNASGGRSTPLMLIPIVPTHQSLAVGGERP